MNLRKILKKFPDKELKKFAFCVNKYFPLVKPKRIYELLLQVDSIDTTLHLLVCHEESDQSLDNIVFQYLQGQDNKNV